MGNAVLRGMHCQLRDTLTDFQKKWHSWLRRGHHPTCKNRGQSVQRGSVCACVKLSTSGIYFFLFFNGPYASLQVGPLDRSSPLTAQMTRPRGHHDLFMALLIRKIFSLFLPKNVKNCITPYMGTLNSYSFGIVEDTYKLFHQLGGFRSRAIWMVSFKFTPDWPLLPWQPIEVISTQNWP